MNTPPHDSATWWSQLWRRRTRTETDSDALVDQWRAAWSDGARARWRAASSAANPFASGPTRSAWDAGWRWAGQHPDRRKETVPRLAHRRRRMNDSPPRLKHAFRLGAAGLAVFAISKALRRRVRET
jgi:hypothetical protein